jgi:hypothetical protein
MKLNNLIARRQWVYGSLLIIFFMAIITVTMDFWANEVPRVDSGWGKIGIVATMFGTIMTFFEFFVVSGYRKARIELNAKKEQLARELLTAQYRTDEKTINSLENKIEAVGKEDTQLNEATKSVDFYDRAAIGTGILIIEIGLLLQLFSA